MSQNPQENLQFYHSTDKEHRVCEKLDNFESILPAAAQGENSLYSNVSRALGSSKSCSVSETSSQDPKPVVLNENTNESPSPSGSGSSRGRASSKVCEVCGDRAKSFHFGGVSCDSCKAFFRRAVQSDSHNSFRCPYDGSCVITVTTRKTCQACRFKRCLQIGMEKKWVMNEDERNTFQKQRQEKKIKKIKGSDQRIHTSTVNLSVSSPVDSFEPDVADMLKFMSVEDQSEIETLVMKVHESYIDIPYQVSQAPQSRISIEIIEMFTTILRRIVYFHKNLADFSQLSQEDQSTLLRQGVLEMCMLRSALTYDFKNNRWPMQTGNMEFLRNCPVLRVEDMKKLVSPDLYDMQMRFISGIQELLADEPIVTLLTLIVLFSPDRTGLLNQKAVGIVQDKYLRHLENYTLWRFGPHGSKMYPKFLTKLSDLRQLTDSHNEYNLRLAQREVNQIQEQLSSINLNPYTQWDAVKCDNHSAVGHVNPSKDPRDISQSTSSIDLNDLSGEIPGEFPFIPEKLQTLSMSQMTAPTAPLQPSMAGILFSQMVNQQIPILIEEFQDPLIPTDQEVARVSKLFLPRGASRLSKIEESSSYLSAIGQCSAPSVINTGLPAYEPEMGVRESLDSCTAIQPNYTVEYNQGKIQHNPKCYSALKNLLECIGEINDPNFLEQVKQSFSPEVLKRLQNAFAPGIEKNATAAIPTAICIPQFPATTPQTSTDPPHIAATQVEVPGTENDCVQIPNPVKSHQVQNILRSFGYKDAEVEVRGSDFMCNGGDAQSRPGVSCPHTFTRTHTETSSHSECYIGAVPVSSFEKDETAISEDEKGVINVLVSQKSGENMSYVPKERSKTNVKLEVPRRSAFFG
ncbi:unnamed protein product [Allacma fusca]|uniref:Uncharacterized protein n=1 Tax=Allacma fusca TaxID=39272 RepID=A0A8J2NPZ3_9HEXA|nr:unnamed protein product [Allacma fusca]